MGRYYGPYHQSAELYKLLGQYDLAKLRLEQLADAMQPNIQNAQHFNRQQEFSYMFGQQASLRIQAKMVIVEQFENENKLEEALEEVKRIEDELRNSEDPMAQFLIHGVTQKRQEIEGKLGISSLPFDISQFILQ